MRLEIVCAEKKVIINKKKMYKYINKNKEINICRGTSIELVLRLCSSLEVKAFSV